MKRSLGKETFLKDLTSNNPKVKYACAKRLTVLAELNPGRLYPRLDFFINMLDHENQILKWTAIDIVGHLTESDKIKKIDRILKRLFGFLNAGKLITAGHAITALAGIATAKPKYRGKITNELLKVEHYKYDTDECRNIVIGIAIKAIGPFFAELKDRKTVIDFVKRQLKNRRHATQIKAEQFLKKYVK
jgi:hypothetical protein